MQCERLANETGCWLFFGAQHLHANKPFVHYSSERLRRDAEQELNDIATKFGMLCSSLVAARRADTLVMAQKLAIAEQEKESAERALQNQNALLSVQKALIAEYEKQLSSKAT